MIKIAKLEMTKTKYDNGTYSMNVHIRKSDNKKHCIFWYDSQDGLLVFGSKKMLYKMKSK